MIIWTHDSVLTRDLINLEKYLVWKTLWVSFLLVRSASIVQLIGKTKTTFKFGEKLYGGVFFDLRKSAILQFWPTPNPLYYTSDLLAPGLTTTKWTCGRVSVSQNWTNIELTFVTEQMIIWTHDIVPTRDLINLEKLSVKNA